MSLSDLASIGSFVSGLAVLVSLIYLSLQIRQNTKHSQALIQQGRADRTADLMMRFAEFDWPDGLDRCWAGSTDISASDLRRFLYAMRAGIVGWEDSFLQHTEGLLDGAAFENFSASVRDRMNVPGIRMAWKLLRRSFGPEFRDYMDRILAATAIETTTGDLSRWKAVALEGARMVPE